MKTIYHYQSSQTGEVVHSLIDVFKAMMWDYKHYKFLNIHWKYSRKGF